MHKLGMLDEYGCKILPTEAEIAKDAEDCDICHDYPHGGPSHGGTRSCRNGASLASGGIYRHCTCSACF